MGINSSNLPKSEEEIFVLRLFEDELIGKWSSGNQSRMIIF